MYLQVGILSKGVSSRPNLCHLWQGVPNRLLNMDQTAAYALREYLTTLCYLVGTEDSVGRVPKPCAQAQQPHTAGWLGICALYANPQCKALRKCS